MEKYTERYGHERYSLTTLQLFYLQDHIYIYTYIHTYIYIYIYIFSQQDQWNSIYLNYIYSVYV
jgi:hypothetical protein